MLILHPVLQTLVTDPTYARRGAASLLLKWGTDQANELGIPIYLESSPGGHELYLRYGFKDMEVHEMDMTTYGLAEIHRVWPMMYNPRTKQSN